MLYLLDANVLIDANRDYYPLDRIPEFWAWLEHQGEAGHVAIPHEVYDEAKVGNDKLADWCKTQRVKDVLRLAEEPDVELVRRVLAQGYGPDLTDDDIARLGRDPFLVAYGLVDAEHRCIVTTERSKPSRQGANRHLPDVCADFGLRCCDTFQFVRALDFRTSWKP